MAAAIEAAEKSSPVTDAWVVALEQSAKALPGANGAEDAALADAMTRRPVENGDSIALGHPVAQYLARLVPVDQENQRRPDRFEKGIASRHIRSRKAAGDEVEHPVIAETFDILPV